MVNGLAGDWFEPPVRCLFGSVSCTRRNWFDFLKGLVQDWSEPVPSGNFSGFPTKFLLVTDKYNDSTSPAMDQSGPGPSKSSPIQSE